MQEQSDVNVKLEIQQTLHKIEETTFKIVKELKAINEMVQENGSLNIAVDNANRALSNIIRDRKIQVNISNENENEEGMDNSMIPTTMDIITEQLMTIINKDQ